MCEKVNTSMPVGQEENECTYNSKRNKEICEHRGNIYVNETIRRLIYKTMYVALICMKGNHGRKCFGFDDI